MQKKDYTTYQQHEPLRAPLGWSTQEKRFVAQLEELFDDIYKRYNRLRLEDMSPAFRKSFKKIQDDGSEMMTQIELNATGISTLVTKTGINNVGQNETLYSKITQNAGNISAEVTRATTAEGTLSGKIELNATNISAEVTRATTTEGTLSGKITLNESSISTLVSKTGINNLGQNDTLYSKITQNAGNISAEVTRATTAEGTLSGRITTTAESISTEVTRAKEAESTLNTSITQTASSIRSEVSSTYLSKTEASTTYATKSEIVQDDTSWMATFKKIGAQGYTAEGITTITENGITVTHNSLSNCKTEMSASGFRILDAQNTVIGGVMSLGNKVVTAMNTLYNPAYPSFRLEVNQFNNPIGEESTLIDGIGFVYDNLRWLGIGIEYNTVTGNIVGNTLISTKNLYFLSHNKDIRLENGVTSLSLYPTSGSESGDIQLRHSTHGVGVFVTDTDVLIKYKTAYGGVVTLKASNYFQPQD